MNILFVCLGNICRSPTAEAVFKKMVLEAELDSKVFIDSCGTGAWHQGSPADARMREHALLRDYHLESLARQFDEATDFQKFDLILTMDDRNFADLFNLDESRLFQSKIKRMTDYCTEHNVTQVPDPYYGGDRGFELVIDIIEDASRNLLMEIKKQLGL